MSQRQKFLQLLLNVQSVQNIDFQALCQLLQSLGLQQRIRGSHHLFGKTGIPEALNLQPGSGGAAKPYQVKQVRAFLLKYRTELELILD